MSDKNQFCRNCKNLLNVDTAGENLVFSCPSCGEEYKTTANDTLRYEEIKGTNLMVFNKIIKKITDDPANPKKYITCACGGKIVKQARLGKGKKLINACITKKCGNIWIN